MSAAPVAIVLAVRMTVDPADPVNSTLIMFRYQLLFCGPVELAEDGQVSVLNASTLVQIKAATNAVMIASALAKGFSLVTARILSPGDVTGA